MTPRTLVSLLVAALAVCLTLGAAPGEAAAQTKIAVIDLHRAVYDTEDGLRVQSKLKQLFDSRQVELDAKDKAYADAKTEFEKDAKGGKLSQDQLQAKYESLAKQRAEIQQLIYDYRREMQQRETEAMMPVIQRMLSLVRRLASENGYEMVLSKEAVPYFRSDLDITDRVIQMYNTSIGPAEEAPADKPEGKDKKKDPKKPAEKPAATSPEKAPEKR